MGRGLAVVATAVPRFSFRAHAATRSMSLPKTTPKGRVSLPMGAVGARGAGNFRVLDEPTENKLAFYRLGKQIGSGNYAVVKEAVDLRTKQHVAVKIMDKAKCGRAMCRNEVDILFSVNKRVAHKRVTPVLDVFEDDTHLYIVLELLRGGELFDRVIERGRLPEAEVARIIRKLAYALEALHRHGILHRDIKLENIVLDAEDDFKIADFGFATEAKPALTAAQAAAAAKRQGSKLAGTLGYCAPEVLRDQTYLPACDVWSAGVVMFILLCGYPPFPLAKHDDEYKTQEERIKAELEAIEFCRQPNEWRLMMQQEPWPHISAEAKALLGKMLQPDPARRVTIKGVLQHPFIVRFSEAPFEFESYE